MPLGNGAVTLKRLRVIPRDVPITEAWVWERMRRHLIRPLGVEDAETESTGWCHPFTGEPEINDWNEIVYGDAFVFGLRTDTKKIPTTLMRLQLRAAMVHLARESGQADDGSGKRIPKKIRDAARERIEEELLKHTLPSIRLLEVVWHLQSNEIWLTTGSKGVVECFQKQFWETFELPLIQVTPGTGAVEFDRLQSDSDYSLEKLFDLVPALFVADEVGGSVAPIQPTARLEVAAEG